MSIHSEDHIDVLIGTGARFQPLVRTYNLCRREGVDTVEKFMALTPDVVAGWRNANEKTWPDIARIQGEVAEPRQRPTKGDAESQTSFTVRLLVWEAWWQGHDAACDRTFYCLLHDNPYQEA